MWAILYFMFNFSIFNITQWQKLARAELHGFAGFVFGILILSALPMYVATTTLIIRTKKPLITATIPKIKLPKPSSKPSTTPKPTTESDTPDTTPTDDNKDTQKLPEDLPPELHSAYIRAYNHIPLTNIVPPQTNTSESILPNESNDTLPLPTDFDIQLNNIPGMEDTPTFNMPVFTDINFDDAIEDTENAIETTTHTPDNSDLIKYLTEHNIPHEKHDDIITTPTRAIITHSDENFWVADKENWFANGQTRPALQLQITEFATAHNLEPVIYLAAQNIMDIDQHIKSWQSDGITIITSPDELNE